MPFPLSKLLWQHRSEAFPLEMIPDGMALKIIRINFDDICQKYSKYFRIEFAHFSFCVGLLLCQIFVFQTGHRK